MFNSLSHQSYPVASGARLLLSCLFPFCLATLEDGDPALLIAALGDIAKAKGMSEISRESGLAREALYKALRAGAQPRFDTVMRVLRTLVVRLVAQPLLA